MNVTHWYLINIGSLANSSEIQILITTSRYSFLCMKIDTSNTIDI